MVAVQVGFPKELNDVCFGSKADITPLDLDVRLIPKADMEERAGCPLSANSGHGNLLAVNLFIDG